MTGTSLQPSAPGAVHPSIPTDLPCSAATLISLSAICSGLLSETLSGDVMFLAMMRAQKDALAAGVPPEEYERVQEVILKHWEAKRARNPLSGLF